MNLTDSRQRFLDLHAAFLREPGMAADPAGAMRSEAIARFGRLGLPTRKVEEWRFTSLDRVAATRFSLGGCLPDPARLHDLLVHAAPYAVNARRIVFANGRFCRGVSSLEGLPAGVSVASLAESSLNGHADLLGRMDALPALQNQPFVALNGAFLRDGALVVLAPGAKAAEPIHLVFLTDAPDGPLMSCVRNLVVAGPGSQASIVETCAGPDGQVYMTNVATHVEALENSSLEHVRVQREGGDAFHFAAHHFRQARDASVAATSVAFGAALARNDVSALLDGEGASHAMNGLYALGGEQHSDHHTRIDHAAPHCDSQELYKGILGGRAHAVFNGRIVVRPGAQKTNSRQTNKNLLLSTDALVNTNPQLEIFADDVKCTHGATVGQLDETSMFYLRSRGIPEDEARRLLVYAFANDVVGRIRAGEVRSRLERDLMEADLDGSAGKGAA